MNFASIFMAMAELFLILIVGYCCFKGGLFSEKTQSVLTRLVIYITQPCMIVYSVLSSERLPGFSTMLLILGVSVGCYIAALGIGLLFVRIARVRSGSRGTYVCMLLCPNSGFIGFPVVEAIFGREAVFYSSIFNIPFYPAIYVVGSWFLQMDAAARREEQARLQIKPADFLNPCLIASVLAVVLALTGLRLPAVLTDTIGLLANITTPCALLTIGISIGKLPLKSILGSPRLYAVTAVRLVLLPALVWFVLHFFIADQLLLGVATVIFGMPVAANVGMVAAEQGADETAAVQSIFITTVLSMITIPLLVTILM